MAKPSQLGNEILYMDAMADKAVAFDLRKKYPDVYRYLESGKDYDGGIPKSEKKVYKQAVELHLELSNDAHPIANPANDVKISSSTAGVMEDMCAQYGHHLDSVFSCQVLIAKVDDDKKVPLLIVIGARNELNDMASHIDDDGDKETVEGLVENLQDILDRNTVRNPKKKKIKKVKNNIG